MMFEKFTSLGYRDDIQGLRALCSLMIMSFHIWWHKVSGGVDVFFVISGFLMASILLRNYFIHDKYNPIFFWSSIARRVFPSAYIVLVATLILSYFVLSPSFLSMTLDEVIAAMFHMENIQLIRKSVDYLASDVPSSPVQQFWALSLQMQFYIILPLLMIPLAIISKKMSSAWPIFAGVTIIILCSFSYSVATSYTAPQSSYFNPAARLWEFFSGVMIYLLAVNITKIYKRSLMCSLGLVIILSGAVFIPASFQFPGYIALVPVVGVGMVIVSGVGGQGDVNKWLGNQFLKYLGGISFSIYLWHWPILVFYKEYYDVDAVGLSVGIAIITTSILLAIISNLSVENQIGKFTKSNLYVNLCIGVIFCLPAVFISLVVKNDFISIEHEISNKWSDYSFDDKAAGKIEENIVAPVVSRDELIAARRVIPTPYNTGCHQSGNGTIAKRCSFGAIGSDIKVVLVGGSHALQWLPAVRTIAKKNNFEIISMSKSSCPLGALKHSDISCKIWNDNVLTEIEKINPVFVITNSTRTTTTSEYIPDEYVDIWMKIKSLNIKLIGIRDNPRFTYDVPDCAYKDQVSRHHEPCIKRRVNSLSKYNPAIDYPDLIGNIDLSDWLCDDEICPVVNDGLLMYRDPHHVHVPYVKYLTKVIEKQMSLLVPEIVNL